MNTGQIQTEWNGIVPGSFNVEGLTTLTWGTEGDGISGGYGYGNYVNSLICKSYSEEDRIEEIDIEQGSGFEAIVILLNKGKTVKLTVFDDTSIAPPTLANNPLTISSPFSPSFNVLLVGREGQAEAKQAGLRTFTLKSFNAIAVAH